MALFESYERRINQITPVLEKYELGTLEDCRELCKSKGFDPYEIVKETQAIAFENAGWAYTLGAAIALKKGCTKAADAAEAIGEGLQAFCIPGSVADNRKVGLGHGNLGGMLLREETECFAFLAGHESFAAAEGAIKIAEKANKVRKKPLRVILNGLGKRAGNAALEEVLMALKHVFRYDMDIDTKKFKELSEYVSNASGRELPAWKAIVGSNMFKHESGIHADGALKDPKNYEAFEPEEVGLQRQIVIGKHSGKAAIINKFLEYDIELSPEMASKVLEEIRSVSVRMKRSLFDKEIVGIYYDLLADEENA